MQAAAARGAAFSCFSFLLHKSIFKILHGLFRDYEFASSIEHQHAGAVDEAKNVCTSMFDNPVTSLSVDMTKAFETTKIRETRK